MGIAWHNWLARPEWLWLLLVLPALGGLALWSRRQRRRALLLLGGGPAFADALTRSRKRGPWLFLSLWLGLALLVVGIAGPQWGRDWNQSVSRGRDLVVVLDLSGSMLAETPSRLERAQAAALDVCERVRQRGGHRLGLVVFAGHARLACPLTSDCDFFREMVRGIDGKYLDPALRPDENAVSGTRIGEALLLAVDAHAKEAHGVQDILLLSDGDDPAEDEEWRLGMAAARDRDIPVHTVGIGNPDKPSPIPAEDGFLFHDGDKVMTRLQEKPLQEIAQRTQGRYVPLHTSDYPLGELYLDVVAAGSEHEHGVDALPIYRQRAVWFLTPAFVLLMASLFLGEGRRVRTV